MTHNELEHVLDEYLSPLKEENSPDVNDDECSQEALQRYLECLSNGKHKKRRRCISGELGSIRFD